MPIKNPPPVAPKISLAKPKVAFMAKVKNNAMTVGVSTVAALATVVGTAFTVDARYAKADDVQQSEQRITQQTRSMIDYLRKQSLEDKLFELDLKKTAANGKLSTTEAALYEHYQRQLDDIRMRSASQAASASQAK